MSAARARAGFLGGGIGFRRPHRDALLSRDDDAPRPALLELMACHFYAEPERARPLAERYPVVLHDVSLSLGTAAVDDVELLRRVRAVVEVARPALFSEHLSLTRSPQGIDLGHLAPLWYTEEALALVIDRVRRWQDALCVPIALETITQPFVIPEADLDEPAFLRAVCEATGCGVLLDLTNLLVNARNLGFDARLAEYPLEHVVAAHLAGGTEHGGYWVDSHSEPVCDESFRLLSHLKERAPLVAVVVERDERLPPLDELVREAKRAEAVVRGEEP